MSNIQPRELKTVVTKDGIVDWCEELMVVEKASANNQDFPVVSTNFSSSQASFTININSRDAVIDRNIMIECPLTLTLTTLSPIQGNLLYDNQYAFRDFPINRMISSITLSIGNVSVTSQVADLIPALARSFVSDVNKYTSHGTSVTMADQYKYYRNSLGSSRNPLNNFDTGGLDNVNPRGAYPVIITGNNTTQAVLQTTLYEPLFISPLIASLKERVIGFTHLTQILVQIQWCSDASRMFSAYSDNILPPNKLIPSLVWGQPLLRVCQYTDALMIAPSVTSYAYAGTSRYTTDFVVPQNSNNFSVATQNVQLDVIPKYMLLYAMPNWNNCSPTVSSHFLPINTLQINFNNVSYCSSMSQNDLYKYSVQNGVDMNFLQWNGTAHANGRTEVPTVGSVVCFKFGDQIPLPSQWSVGCSVKCNISANVQLYNNDVSPLTESVYNYTLYMAFVNDSVVSLFGSNSGSVITAPLTEVDVLQSQKESPVVNYSELNTHGFGSGSGLGKLSNYVTSGKFRQHVKSARAHAPLIKYAGHQAKKYLKSKGGLPAHMADVLHTAGFGDGDGDGEGEGVVNRHSDYIGTGMTGGRYMSRSSMKKHLLN